MEESEFLEILDREITKESYKDLVSYVQYIIDKKYLWRRKDKTIPEGKTAEDFVQETFIKIIDGDREWNPQKSQDHISYLKSHIKSVIYSTFVRIEHKLTSKTLNDFNDNGDLTIDVDDESPDILTLTELREEIKEIYKLVEDDDGVTEILLCYESGIYKRSEIADNLDISPDEVTARFKRLERKLRKYKKL